MTTLTIFTPSYNNGIHIKKLYQSLLKQTCKDFEWLIVDDGSSDNTRDIVHGFQEGSDFKIDYIYQENKGKYKAHYYAINQCKTMLFCCIDADIVLYENIIETMLKEWEDYKNEPSIIGIGMPIIYFDSLSRVIGGIYPDGIPTMGRLSELTSRYKYCGETAYVFLTEILKDLTILDVLDEKFLTESALYFPLNKKYKVHWLNVPVGESVYQKEGLTNNRIKNEISSPKLTLFSFKRGGIFHPLFLHRVANCCMYISWKRLVGARDESDERIPILVYLIALFLEPVYCKKFRKTIREGLKIYKSE